MQVLSWVFWLLNQAFHLSTFVRNPIMQTETHVTFVNTACMDCTMCVREFYLCPFVSLVTVSMILQTTIIFIDSEAL